MHELIDIQVAVHWREMVSDVQCSFLLGYVYTKAGTTDVILLGWFIASALVVHT